MAASLNDSQGWAFTAGHVWRGATVLRDVTPPAVAELTPLAFSSDAESELSVLYGRVTSTRSTLGSGDLLGAVLETTIDGGRSWPRTPVAPVRRLAGYGFWPLTDPTAGTLRMSLADARHGYLAAAAVDARAIPYTALVAATTDGGAHWSVRGTTAAGPVAFFDPLHGFIRPLSGQALVRTADGGHHWAAAVGLPADATMPVTTPAGLLSSAIAPDQRRAVYYRSTDPGASWREIARRVAPNPFQVAQAGVGSSGQLWAEDVITSGDGRCQLAMNIDGRCQLHALPLELYSMQLTLGPRLLWAAIPRTSVSDDHNRLATSTDQGRTWTLAVGRPVKS